MTDLSELKRLAEAAHKWNLRYLCIEGYVPPLPPNQPRAAMAEFREACLPSTILSLIKRVEEAERLKDVVESYAREEAEARAVIPAHCQLDLPDGGDVKLHEAITRLAAESHARGVAEERERAAKVVSVKANAIAEDERDASSWGGPDPRGPHAARYRLEQVRDLRAIATSIRKGE